MLKSGLTPERSSMWPSHYLLTFKNGNTLLMPFEVFDKQILYPGEMPGHNFQTRLTQFKRKFKTVVDWAMLEEFEVEEHKQKQKLAPSKQKEAKVREKFMNEDCGICKVPRHRCSC